MLSKISKLLLCHDFNTNKKELISFINLILNIFCSHQPSESFNEKIFDNWLPPFNMFKNDKRILTIDEEILNLINKTFDFEFF